MSKQDLLRIQSCVLKVNIHCDGCEQKVKKLLQKIDGVYSVSVDAEQGKAVVAGDVDPAKLVKKLKRAGKHAEILGGQGAMMYNQNYPINQQFQNLLVDNGKGGKDNKSQNHKGQKGSSGGGGALVQPAQLQVIKGVQDLKLPAKEQKSVRFKLPEDEFDASDDGFDEYDDNFDSYDEDEEEAYGHAVYNKMMPIMGDGRGPHGPAGMMNGPAGMMNGPAMNNHNDKGAKKGDIIDQVMQIKGKDGNYNEPNIDNNWGKKSNGDQKGKNSKREKHTGGSGGHITSKQKNAKSDGGLLGRFLGFGKKKSKKVEEAIDTNKGKNHSWGGDNKAKEGKKGGAKLEAHSKKNSKSEIDFDFHEYDAPPLHKNGKSDKASNGRGNESIKVGQKGPIMGDKYPVDQMGNIPAVRGLPAMNGGGGYYQGMQMQPAPYNLQQQQYMNMMMNQQHQMQQQQQQQQANMNNMYPTPMMYGRPHPSMNYMPPPPMPSHPMSDPITHTFSDENVESCSIM